MNIPKIQSTTDYSKFQIFDENRLTTEPHIQKFVDDPSFPKKFPFSPIVVDKEYNIIDGQHRFQAAKKMNIPIYFIVDDTACLKDISTRNSQVKKWSGRDFVAFYAKIGKKPYILIKELMEKYGVRLSQLRSSIGKIVGQSHMRECFMNGNLDFDLNDQFNLENYFSKVLTVYNRLRLQRPDKAHMVFISDSYMGALADLYINESNLLDRYLNKAPVAPYELFVYVGNEEDAKKQIGKIARWHLKSARS